jgi:hypothetical protein
VEIMKSFILQPGFEESMKKVEKRNYRDIEKELSKLDNGIKNFLTEGQKEKYNLHDF